MTSRLKVIVKKSILARNATNTQFAQVIFAEKKSSNKVYSIDFTPALTVMAVELNYVNSIHIEAYWHINQPK